MPTARPDCELAFKGAHGLLFAGGGRRIRTAHPEGCRDFL